MQSERERERERGLGVLKEAWVFSCLFNVNLHLIHVLFFIHMQGVPTHDKDGKEISKNLRKKLTKKWNSRKEWLNNLK